MKLVKVGRVGGKVTEVAVEDNASISHALTAAGLLLKGEEDVFVNAVKKPGGTMHHGVMAGDLIILEKRKTNLSGPRVRLCEYLVYEEILNIDLDDYYDEDTDEVDINEFYLDNQSRIEEIIKKAKEC